ncbi:mechanosensitive ion channel [Candidatus Roizmanbacteria bacterium]|nr:mechanosensitive ion channel [Candidatus Roizmanbacteria bacterium]
MELFVAQIYIPKFIFSIVVLLITLVLSLSINYLVRFFFSNIKDRIGSPTARAKSQTMYSLLKNVIDVLLFAIAIMIILSEWGVNIGPILTGAGVLGLAFSFGAQTLVKDVISGFFIIAENQYNIGDRIQIGEKEGKVRKITLRLTILETDKSDIIYIPNSQITLVTRRSVSSK